MEYPVYQFGSFTLDSRHHRLMRGNDPVQLSESAIRVLEVLLSRAQEIVDKNTLLDAGWPDSVVVPDNLVQAIHAIRSALGGDARSPVFIKTVHRQGYSFVVPVSIHENEGSSDEPEIEDDPVQAPVIRHMHPLVLLLLFLTAIGLIFGLKTFFSFDEPPTRRISAIAVLPMEELSAGPDQEFFADGMTDALITELARIPGLNVISRTSVMKFKNTRLSVPEIARELDVDAIVESTVTREKGRVRIIAQLVNAEDHHIWGENYESEDRDILRLQRKMAEMVAQAIGERLSGTERKPHAVDPKAHEAYLRGRYVLRMRNKSSFFKAQEFFQRAIEIDPKYAEAYSGMADTYNLLANYGFVPTPPAREQARKMALRALELDPGLAEAHLALALVAGEYDWDFKKAEKEFAAALALMPSSAEIRARHAQLLVARGRLSEAVKEIQRAGRGDPLSEIINSNVAWYLFLSGHPEDAVKKLDDVLTYNPGFPVAWYYLGSICTSQKDHARAVYCQTKATSLSDGSSYAEAALANALARAGRVEQAENILEALRERKRSTYVSPVSLAVANLGLGHIDQAFIWLEKAFEERKGWLLELRVDPVLDPVRHDPRYLDLVDRIGLAPVDEVRQNASDDNHGE